MARRPVVLMGDPVLRQRASEVAAIDDKLRSLAAEMFETMEEAEGIGLAAPQVGVPVRLFVCDIGEKGPGRLALVNPSIEESSQERDKYEEGCLSIPGVSDLVERPTRVVVRAQTLDGKEVRFAADALLARCFQHEIDHLDGVLFIDRLSPLKRKLLLDKYRKLRKEE